MMKNKDLDKGTVNIGQKKNLEENIKENWFAKVGVHSPYTVAVFMLIILILGVFSLSTMHTELYPNMNIPYAIVATAVDVPAAPSPDDPDYQAKMQSYMQKIQEIQALTPQDVEKLTIKMEQALLSVTGIKNIESSSSAQMSLVIIEFNDGAEVDQYSIFSSIQTLDFEVNGVKFTNPQIQKLDPSMMPVMTISTTFTNGDTDAEKLSWFQNTFVPALKRTNGVAQVSPVYGDLDKTLVNASYSRFNGETSYTFQITKSSDAITTDVVGNIKAALDKIKEDYGGFTYNIPYSQGDFIEQSVGNVLNDLVIGGLLAVLILFVFLRRVKLTLAIAISIPLSIIGTFVAMYFMGMTLNIVSMAGLALAVGMVVDNSIVVLENIYRLRAGGASIKDSAIKGASQVVGSILAGTLTTICVFFPMFFVEGLMMRVFMDMIWVIIWALLISLAVAVGFLPAIVATLKLDNVKKVKKAETENVETKMPVADKKPNWLSNAYDKTLSYVMKNKWWAIALSFVLFVGSIFLAIDKGFELLPASDQGEFSTTISINRGAADKMTKVSALMDNEGLYKLFRNKYGEDADILISYNNGQSAMSVLSGGGENITVSVVLPDNYKKSTGKAAEDATQMVKEHLTGDMMTDANLTAFAKDIESTGGSDMSQGMVATSITVSLATNVETDPHKSLQDALTNDDLLNKLRAVTGVEKVSSDFSAATILHSNKNVVGSIEIKLKHGQTISKVQEEVDKVIEDFADEHKDDIFKGIYVVESDFSQQMADTSTGMGLAIGIGFILLYLVMVAMFQSWISPFIVIITVFLAFTGAFAALWLFNLPLSVPSMVGLLVLMGVIVNNGILIIDFINKGRAEGKSVYDAVKIASKMRIRPILMTAITTILGFLPMAFGDGTGGSLMMGLALAVIGGLTYATIMTLFIVPAFYLCFNKDKPLQNQA
ncbi:MAG: efflux RND transporter permease subunit [Christensenellaceae bacterium]|jgi:HAE1 family hydrophobic/amphiphilic exporter-1|nr:efflux RND transporter permease subunit [Christensenellaceae bacterium]